MEAIMFDKLLLVENMLKNEAIVQRMNEHISHIYAPVLRQYQQA
jgi:hypothetical protein